MSEMKSTEVGDAHRTACEGLIAGDVCDEDNNQNDLVTVEPAKYKYLRLLSEMVETLSIEHLEPWFAVLVQCEGTVVRNQEDLIRWFKKVLLQSLTDISLQAWENYNITDSLETLELLKERFKEYKSINWGISEMKPNQRLLPLRIHYKESTKKRLEKEISLQNNKLQELIEVTSKQRARINDITNRRVYLREAMNNNIANLAEKEEKLKQLREKLLND